MNSKIPVQWPDVCSTPTITTHIRPFPCIPGFKIDGPLVPPGWDEDAFWDPEAQNVYDAENLTGTDKVSTVEERNTEVFFMIADVLDFHPQLYDQQTFGWITTSDNRATPDDDGNITGANDIFLLNVESCRTSACVAGWAAILDGWHPTLSWDGAEVTLNYHQVAREPWAPATSDEARQVTGVAQEILGITDAEADSLFDAVPAGALDKAWTGDELRAIGKGRSVFSDNWPVEGS